MLLIRLELEIYGDAMNVITEPLVQWTTAVPLWSETLTTRNGTVNPAFLAPTILRFASDSFMDEFMTLLNTQPGRLGERRVQPETWREPLPLPSPLTVPSITGITRTRPTIPTMGSTASPLAGTATGPLKLYQAAHQRFYLVSACLICRHVPGLPDRFIDIANQERVTFVMRRLRPHVANNIPDTNQPDSYDEFAFVPTAQGNTWQMVPGNLTTALFPGEEQIPLFPVSFLHESGHRRRLHSGLIPVGKRETYLGTPLSTTVVTPTPGLRETLLNMQVIQPWENLSGLDKTTQQGQNQIQVASWYILLDFATYLARYLPNVWQVVKPDTLNAVEQHLFNVLENTLSSTMLSFRTALTRIEQWRHQLENVVEQYQQGSSEWPDFLFALSDSNLQALLQSQSASSTEAFASVLETLVAAALPVHVPEATLPAPPIARRLPESTDQNWFAIRCVFERPHCGPLKPAVVSSPTVAFQLAGFFDPDAPGRAIRISLPVDTSIAGLRKFNKNVAFAISNKLRQQMDCATGTDVHKLLNGTADACTERVDLGMICSFSIPIITICAMIVLMIFVILMNIIFFWVPFLKICFPLPLKAKE